MTRQRNLFWISSMLSAVVAGCDMAIFAPIYVPPTNTTSPGVLATAEWDKERTEVSPTYAPGVYIHSVDGARVDPRNTKISVTPGRHQLVFGFTKVGYQVILDEFDCGRSGTVYTFRFPIALSKTKLPKVRLYVTGMEPGSQEREIANFYLEKVLME